MPRVKTVPPLPKLAGWREVGGAMRFAVPLVVLLLPAVASAWAGLGAGTPPPPHDYGARELRRSVRGGRTFAPWCAFMSFGDDAPAEAIVRIAGGASMPDGVEITVAGDLDPAAVDRFATCLRRLIASLPGRYTGTHAISRTLPLGRPSPPRRVASELDALLARHVDHLRACAPGGAAIDAIRLDVYRGEVRVDAVHVPTLDPLVSSAGTGDGSVHDCVSAELSGEHLGVPGRVYPVLRLE